MKKSNFLMYCILAHISTAHSADTASYIAGTVIPPLMYGAVTLGFLYSNQKHSITAKHWKEYGQRMVWWKEDVTTLDKKEWPAEYCAVKSIEEVSERIEIGVLNHFANNLSKDITCNAIITEAKKHVTNLSQATTENNLIEFYNAFTEFIDTTDLDDNPLLKNDHRMRIFEENKNANNIVDLLLKQIEYEKKLNNTAYASSEKQYTAPVLCHILLDPVYLKVFKQYQKKHSTHTHGYNTFLGNTVVTVIPRWMAKHKSLSTANIYAAAASVAILLGHATYNTTR